MERRILLAALGAALATPALAQTAQPPARSGQGSSDMRQGADGSTMSRDEMTQMNTHMERTRALGAASLATSRIAVEKAQNERVKMFARFEVAEQETIAEILNAMRTRDSMVTGSTAAAPPPGARPDIDERGRRALDQMQNAQRGAAFDRMYVESQLSTHQGLLEAQEDYLRAGRDREHMAVAKLARGQIKEHIALLEMMQGELGRRG